MESNKKEVDFMWLLDAPEKYNMDQLESTACKIAAIWLDLSRKTFPDYRHSTMKKGDPRKSLIFKICYKLARETQGILDSNDINLYVRAQLDVLKYINSNNSHPLIDPNCLVGEKAWKRWKLWKKRYDTIKNKPPESIVSGIGFKKAIEGIIKTKEFIVKSFGDDWNIEKFRQCYINNNIFRWINLSKISPYYLAISPFVKEVFTEDDFKKINFDINVYLPCINQEVQKEFDSLFDEKLTT